MHSATHTSRPSALSRREYQASLRALGAHRARRIRTRAPRWVSMLLAPVLIASAAVSSVLLVSTAASADGFTPTVSISGSNPGVRATDFILAGEDSHYDLSVANDGPDQKFNVSVTALVPAEVTFVDASYLGTPTTYTAGASVPNATRTSVPDSASCAPLVPAGAPSTLCAVPAGFQLWVWQNISDLPSKATVTSTLVIRPDADAYTVGSDVLSVDLTAYTSADPTFLPTFDGSTSVSTSGTHTSQPGRAGVQTQVNALRVAKSELESPEKDLLRGIHTQTTTYELRVQNSGEAPTDAVTVVDYLPAGLEYLGAGGTENTADSDSLYDGNREYPTAPDLTGTPAPLGGTGDWNGSGEIVETVLLSAADATTLGLAGAGVYTKVTWTLGTLAGGAPQTYPSSAGTTGEYVIRYRAAVPLFENTLTWQIGSDADAPAPTGTSAQASNLNNNNGPSTRHGIGDPDYNGGQMLTNAVTATGTYAGLVVDDPTDRSAFDKATDTVEAVDLRVQKSVNPNDFLTGDYATYTLVVDTSEYTSSGGISLTDDVANGVCPAIPSSVSTPVLTIDGVPTDQATWNAAVSAGGSAGCAFPNDTRVLTGAAVSAIDFAPGSGAFVTDFVTDGLGADSTTTITYQALQRPTYITTPGENGATSSGDVMVNTVVVRGTTTAIDPIEVNQVSSTGGIAYGVETVADDSRAEIVSNFSALNKTVLERDKTPASASAADWVKRAAEPFAIGDVVWYRVRVDFAAGIETRNPRVTDYLPQGVTYGSVLYSYDITGVGAGTLESAPAGDAADYLPTAAVSGSVLTWQLGDVKYADSPDRFMPENSWVELYIQGDVIGQSASSSQVDIPQNQAKYQQQNVAGDVFFLRDQAEITLDWPAAPLVKGVRDVNGVPSAGNPFDSNVGTDATPVQVAQDDTVTYRIDVTAPNTDSSDFVVWDALPAGISSASGFTAYAVEKVGSGPAVETAIPGADVTATVYAPGTLAGVDAAYAGRTIVVWQLSALIDGTDLTTDTVRGFSLQYDVAVPPDAEVTQKYTNTASIVSYALQNNDGGATTVLPDGPLSTTAPGPGQVGISGVGTYDDAVTQLPAPSISKTLVSTDIAHTGTTPADPNNRGTTSGPSALGQIVQGEIATFRYSVTIPAHSSVAGGELFDDGMFRWTGSPTPPNSRQVAYPLVPGSAQARFDGSATLPAGFAVAPEGVLSFPAVYQNATSSDQVFDVTIQVWVRDADASHPGYTPNFPNNKTLTNTARFTYTNPNTASPASALTATANVSYVEPSPTLAKSHSPAGVSFAGGDVVTYTLKASNAAGRPILYDTTVVDCVPAELTGVAATPSVGTVAISTAGASDPNGCLSGQTKIIWSGFDLGAGDANAKTLVYTATITPSAAAGDSYTNQASLTGFTLPSTYGNSAGAGDRETGAFDVVTIERAAISKSVNVSSAPIGDTVTYTVVTQLPPDVTFYDATITDALPAGVAFDAMTSTVCETASGGVCGFTIPATPAVSGNVAGGQTLTWDLGDVAAGAEERTITQVYTATLTDAVTAAVPANTATFAWNRVNDDPSTQESVTDTAEVTVLNPVLAIDKTVSNAAPNPGEPFDYTVEVTNTGDTAAYNIIVTDVVPAGIQVDTSSISPAPSSIDAGVGAGTGGTITWGAGALPGPLYPAGSASSPKTLTFTYDAVLAASSTLATGSVLTNTASVEHFESFPSGGRVYEPTDVTDTAQVTPPFPTVELTKNVTACVSAPSAPDCDLAYIGDPLSWTITATNSGTGPAQQVVLTDTLPANWDYTAVSSVTVGGAAWPGTTSPVVTHSGTPGDPQQLTWTFGSDAPAPIALAPGAAITIVFTATPKTGALVDPGATGSGVPPLRPPHTNTVTGVTTDTSNATGNAGGAYTGADAEAQAFVHRADLKLIKDAVGGDTSGAWVPGATVSSSYTQPQWLITVTNQGPDASVGPFSLEDTTTLPAGVTAGGFSARYFSGPSDTAGTALTLSGTGTTGDPFLVGDGTTSLRADGSDRIEVRANVTIAASATGEAKNEASVVGRTYETPSDIAKDNSDDATQPLTPRADLVMDKTGPASANAGGPLSWTLSVTNAGPSDSVSVPGALITVTDTVPAGMKDVSVATLPAGWSGPTPTQVFQAGQTITFTLDATASLTASGPAVPFTLSGTIDASWGENDTITNEATVTPGATTDPEPGNNTDDASVTPGIETSLAIAKTRVVFDGTAWVPATSLTPVPPVVPGETVSYLVEVSNIGSADARNVTVTDDVASYFSYASFASVTPSGSAWTHASGGAGAGVDQTFALTPRLEPGETAAFRVALTLNSSMATGETVENTVVADADNSTNQPTDTDSTNDSARDADLTIAKSHTGTAIAGSSLVYTLEVTNLGPSWASGPIEVVDTLPDGFSYQAGSATVSLGPGPGAALEPVVSGQKLTWRIGDSSTSFSNGGELFIVFTSLIGDDVVAGSYVNKADVDSPDDHNPANNHAEDPTTVTNLTNLSIVKDTVDAGPYLAGDTVDYTLTVVNDGPTIARNVVVTDSPDAGLTVTAISGAGWTCDPTASPARCARDTLPVGGPYTITVTATVAASVPEGVTLDNLAVVSTATPETTTSDNESTKAITVTAQADLRLVKTAVDAAGDPITTAIAGEQVGYLLETSNLGPSDAVAPLTIVDTLPAGVTFISLADDADWSAVASPVDPVFGTQEVTLTRRPASAGLAASTSAPPVTLIVAISPSLPIDPITGSTVITNTATVSSGTTDPTPGNNTDTAQLTVTRTVDLAIVKSHDSASVRVGDNLTFDLAVRNDGVSTATGVQVVDTLPAGLTYVDAGATSPAWTVVASPAAADGTTTVTATLTGSIDPGTVPDGDLPPLTDAPRLELTVIVTAEAYALGTGDPKTVVNTATVTAVEPETDPTNNSSADPVIVPPQSTLVVTKSLLGDLQVGSRGSYALAITNRGVTADPGPIVMTDALPAGLTFVSASGSGATCGASGQRVTCTVDAPLGVGETVSVTLTVAVKAAAYPSVTNVVTVSTPTPQLPGGSLTATVTSPVAQDPLAHTGGTVPWWLSVVGLVLLLGGVGVYGAQRRRN